MLSGESANGKFPVESIETMRTIINSAESVAGAEFHVSSGADLAAAPTTPYEATAAAAVAAANHGNASAIVTVSKTGETARLVAKYRPNVPVVAVCLSAKVARQLSLTRGVHPVVMTDVPTSEMFSQALSAAKAMGCCEVGDEVVVLSSEEGELSGLTHTVPTMRVAYIE